MANDIPLAKRLHGQAPLPSRHGVATSDAAALPVASCQSGSDTEHFRFAAENASDGIIITALDGLIVWVNASYCRIMGRTPDEMLGRNPLSFCLPLDDQRDLTDWCYDPVEDFGDLVLRRNRRKSGELFWNQMSASQHQAADGTRFVIIVCRDVTKQIDREQQLRDTRAQLEHAATHDTLTDLANRGALERFARGALATGGAGRVGVLHLDLDRFKDVNDTHGHAGGDAMLIHVARSARAVVRNVDMVGRIGGDEFIVVCTGLSCLADLEAIGHAIQARVAQPLFWQDRTLLTRVSIGAVLAAPDTRDPTDLFQKSDFALYEVKKAGRGRVASYDETLHRLHARQVRMASDLGDAIRNGGLTFVFQPVFDQSIAAVVGFETLARWHHPTRGSIPPDEFLPLARDLGLIVAVDLAAMQAAAAMQTALWAAGHKLGMSMNASADLLTHPDFLTHLTAATDGRDIPNRTFIIEVLETTLFSTQADGDKNARAINALTDLGFTAILDDFGTGHAGLLHLARLAIAGVKIDRSLIRNLTDTSANVIITKSIIDLCRNLQLDVIAEGVETQGQALQLRALGCDFIQGFLVAPPMPPGDVLAWLARRQCPEYAARPVTAPRRRAPAPPANPAIEPLPQRH